MRGDRNQPDRAFRVCRSVQAEHVAAPEELADVFRSLEGEAFVNAVRQVRIVEEDVEAECFGS